MRIGARRIVIALVALAAFPAWPELPPPPKTNVEDKARLISPTDGVAINGAIKNAFEKHDTPIVVCTINSMNEYLQPPGTIENFARQLYDHWQLGTLSLEGGEGANKGILLLVSAGDRKVRIELGADWGRGWDEYCKSIVDSEILPAFRSNNYSEGIMRGVFSLSKMAEPGPASEPPAPGLIQRFQKLKDSPQLSPLSPIPGGIGMIMLGAGVFFCILALFIPNHRGKLLMLGAGLIIAAIALWIIIAIFALFSKVRGGGGFSGGLGGGGFSGGGGASGSW